MNRINSNTIKNRTPGIIQGMIPRVLILNERKGDECEIK